MSLMYNFSAEYKARQQDKPKRKWVKRSNHPLLCDSDVNVFVAASRLATDRMNCMELGVRITFNGLVDSENTDKLVSRANKFTVTIERKD